MIKIWYSLMMVSMIWIFEKSQDLPISKENVEEWNAQTSVQEVLLELGDEKPPHYIKPSPALIKQGEEIVKIGRTRDSKGKKTKYVSKYYSCISCHNLEQEDPNLRISDPAARLTYAKKNNLPFLQGSTFKGIVNRESWYNDDYVKKYGDEKIEAAHENLRESIQLCAIECSQGRPMDNWEIEAVLAYYWSLEFSLGDLEFTAADYEKLNQAKKEGGKNSKMIDFVKSFYNQTSPAHFYDAPPSKEIGYEGLKGNPVIGKDLYELSCLYCHKPGGVSHYILDNSSMSFNHLNKMITKDSHFSLYQIIAYGTYAIPGHKPYMPHYPEERMSKQQVEDLRAYVEVMAD